MKRILSLLLVLLMLCTAASAVTVSEPGEFPIVDEEITLTVMACINTACDSWKNNTTMLEYEEMTGHQHRVGRGCGRRYHRDDSPQPDQRRLS